MSRPKVAISILTTYERHGWVHPKIVDFLEMLSKRAANAPFYHQVITAHNYNPAAYARNELCSWVQDNEFDWLCMIDNDMVPPDNLMDCMLNAPEDAAVVVPRMWMWDNAQGRTAVTLVWGLSVNPTPQRFIEVYRSKGYTELFKAGTGVMFIRRSTILRLQPPYFWYEYHPISRSQLGTEDVNFCAKVRQAGLKIYGYNEVDVGHYHNVDLSAVARLLYDERTLTFGLGPDQKELDNATKECEKESVVV